MMMLMMNIVPVGMHRLLMMTDGSTVIALPDFVPVSGVVN